MLPTDDLLLKMPEADRFICHCWHELGLCSTGFGGFSALQIESIKAYSDMICKLTSFEASMLLMMSREYIREQSLATNEPSREPEILKLDANLYKEWSLQRKQSISNKMRQWTESQTTSR